MPLLEGGTDLVDGVVLFAQGDNRLPGGGLLRLGPRPAPRGREEGRRRIAPEVVAQDVEGAYGVAEGAGRLFRGAPLDEVGPQGLVLALPGVPGLQEEAAACA